MANAKQSIIIDSDELVQGMTTSSNLTDGGISPESEGINLVANPGVVYPTSGATDTGNTGRSFPMLASCNDVGTSSSYDRIFIDSSGRLYGVLGSSGALQEIVVTSPTGTFVYGQTDLIYYSDGVYATENTNIAKYTISYGGSPTAVQNVVWWTSTQGQGNLTSNPHPMIVYNKVLFVADGNKLHTWDGTTATSAVLTMYPNEVITALDIDPGTGSMLVGIVTLNGGFGAGTSDFNSLRYAQAFVGLYDGVNPTQFLRKIPVDAPVTAFRSVGGGVYCVYGNKIGTWNGSGIDFVREMFQSTGLGTPLVQYKNTVSNVNKVFLYTDNFGNKNPYLSNASNKIIAISPIKRGQPSIFPLVSVSQQSIHVVSGGWSTSTSEPGVFYSYFGSDTFEHVEFVPLYSHSTVLSTGDSSPIYVSKRVAFQRPSEVNIVRVFYEDTFATTAASFGTISIVDDNRTVAYSESVPNPSSESGMTNGNGAWFDVRCQVKTTEFQIVYQWTETGTSHGIQKVMVFYTTYE